MTSIEKKNFYLRTFVCGRFICFIVFHGRDVCDAGGFIYLAGEREKPCPGRRLTLNAEELTALGKGPPLGRVN